MDFLKLIIFLFFTLSVQALEYEVLCQKSTSCADYKSTLESKLREISSKEDLYELLQFELRNPLVHKLAFTYEKELLFLEVSLNKKIQSVQVSHPNPELVKKIKEKLRLNAGDIYEEAKLSDTFERLKADPEILLLGELNLKIFENNENEVTIVIDSKSKKQDKISDISFVGVSDRERDNFMRVFSDFIGIKYSNSELKRRIDIVRNFYMNRGFWNINVEQKIIGDDKNLQNLIITIDKGKRIGFRLTGEKKYVSHEELRLRLIREVASVGRPLSKSIIIKSLTEIYKNKGVFRSKFFVREEIGQDSLGTYNMFFIDINEGERVELAEIEFQGNFKRDIQELENLFYENSSVLTQRGFLDVVYINKFQDLLNQYYVERGFVFSKVDKPVISFTNDGKKAFVTFQLSEGDGYVVGDIVFDGVPFDIEHIELEKIMENTKGNPLNVTMLDKDLASLLELLRDRGYYFAELKNKNTKNIVRLDKSLKVANIFISIKSGLKMFMGNIIVSGNVHTKSEVIYREQQLKYLDLVKPSKMNQYLDRLRSLGLFSRVSLTPAVGKLIGDNKALLNFIVKVKELSFGRGELTPGYRTDLGYKLGLSLGWNNIDGLNRSVIWRTRANLRTSYSYLDNRRRAEQANRIEGLTEVQLVEPYIFKIPLEFRMLFRAERKRYEEFDADVFSFSPSLSKRLGENVTLSLKYEFDDIRQFDATTAEDSERYIIGAITPSVSWDLRDNIRAPRSGAWFNLSWEFANPFFLSQEEEELTVNYTRAVLRNYFYVPAGDLTLATSVTLGYEENFATDLRTDANGDLVTRGVIPQLRVFRLTGSDFLRGYSDSESNRLITGEKVADVIVRDKAYLVNFKFEPRYYIGDSSVVSVFYDAGRIFVDSFKPFDLRGSVGLSFKFLTPVGSLDFDYGVKTRRHYIDGKRESFGRFHLSIGQF